MIPVATHGSLHGTGALALQAFRRDRLMAPLWVLFLAGMCYASALGTASIYGTPADRVRAAESFNSSPAIVALYGPITDVRSAGELAMTKMTVLYAVFVAIMCIVLVRRHTRVEEESGRTELVGGTAVGRRAPLAAAVVQASVVALVVGILAAGADVAGGLPVGGSLMFGASWAGLGLVAVGIAAVACQLSSSARTCGEIAAGAVAFLYVLRAAGDTSSATWLSWLSPFGWCTQLQAWSSPRVWVLALFALLAAGLVATAAILHARRDLGSGTWAARPGRARGSARLSTPLALAARLNTPSLVIWSVATAAMAVLFGGIAPGVSDLLDSPEARAMIERLGGTGVLEQTLLSAEISIIAVVLTGFGLSVVVHGAGDERDGRITSVLAGPVARSSHLAATLSVALAGTCWLLFLGGLGLTIGYAGAGGRLDGDLVGAAVAQTPAVWLVVALGVLAWARKVSWAPAGWGLLALFLSLGQVGELVGLPHWVISLSPYSHAPQMPVAPFQPFDALWLTLLTVAALGGAAATYRRRDVA